MKKLDEYDYDLKGLNRQMRMETDGTGAGRITDMGSGMIEAGTDGKLPGRG